MAIAEDVKALSESLALQIEKFDEHFAAAKKVEDGGKCSNDQSVYVTGALEATILALFRAAGAYTPR